MTFGGHQSFHLREQWLAKGLFWAKSDLEAFSNTEKAMGRAMETLGGGKNMVEAIKFWLKSSQLVEFQTNGWALSKIAKKLLKADPYFELDGALFLVHYLLAANKNGGAAWHWFFNHFSAGKFDRESLGNQFFAYAQAQARAGKAPKEKTLEKDLTCLLKMYLAAEWTGRKNPETETPSPFTKYGWIEKKEDGFVRNKLSVSDINIHIFAFILYLFWEQYPGRPESVQLEDLSLKENSPGRIFSFSLEEMSDLTDLCSKTENYLDYSRTGGYFIVRPNEARLKTALDNYYREMKA